MPFTVSHVRPNVWCIWPCAKHANTLPPPECGAARRAPYSSTSKSWPAMASAAARTRAHRQERNSRLAASAKCPLATRGLTVDDGRLGNRFPPFPPRIQANMTLATGRLRILSQIGSRSEQQARWRIVTWKERAGLACQLGSGVIFRLSHHQLEQIVVFLFLFLFLFFIFSLAGVLFQTPHSPLPS